MLRLAEVTCPEFYLFRSVVVQYPCRHTRRDGVVRDVFGDYGIGADDYVVANVDAADDFGAAANEYIVADSWVALTVAAT